jgi:hypothetical protein
MSEKPATIEHSRPEALEIGSVEHSAEKQTPREHQTGLETETISRAAERARHEANQEALFTREYSVHEHQPKVSDGLSTLKVVTKDERSRAYKQTLGHIQSQMPPTDRATSKFIHNPVVERLSDIASATIARPNAILFGGIFAFVGLVAVYAYARFAGFTLKGSETIVIFATGWIIGMLFDIVKNLFRKKD